MLREPGATGAVLTGRDRAGAVGRPRGIATFEFVLVFPILMMLVAALFLVARADTRKSLTATVARNEGWNRTADANPGKVLELGNAPADSIVTAAPTREVPRGPLFPRDTFTAKSRLSATWRTWDRRDVPFEPGRGWMVPHLKELGMIARSVTNLNGVVGNIQQILSRLVFPG